MKHDYIQIAALTPQPLAMMQLRRCLEKSKAKAVSRFLSKYQPETVMHKTARKQSKANNASDKIDVPFLGETGFDNKQNKGGNGDIDKHIKKEEFEDEGSKENKVQPNNSTNNKEAAPQAGQASLPCFLKHDIGHVAQKALLMIVASDVEPPETVTWLPTLCRRKVLYWTIREDVCLGTLVHKKTSPAVAFMAVCTEHMASFSKVLEIAKEAMEGQLD